MVRKTVKTVFCENRQFLFGGKKVSFVQRTKASVALMVMMTLSFACAEEQLELSEAPVNKEFVEWVAARRNAAKTQSLRFVERRDGEFVGGVTPEPRDMSHLRRRYAKTRAKVSQAMNDRGTIPISWDSRSDGIISAVKNQNPYGTCWAHATIACLETTLLKNENREYDLSENNMVVRHGFYYDPTDGKFDFGGNGWKSSAYLLRWDGPLLETQDPYPNDNAGIVLPPAKHVQNVRVLAGRDSDLDNDILKQAIMRYGAVHVSYYHNDSYMKKSTSTAYYCGVSRSTNHAVTLIGWNDNYSKSNFATAPAGNGAFLVKNSWGTGWGDSGYFYVSYYDKTFARGTCFCFPVVEASDNYDEIAQYDPLGNCSAFRSGSGGDQYCANVFRASRNSQICAAGFWAEDYAMEYDIKVYVNCSSSTPTSGTLALTQSGTTDSESTGFQTIALSTPVSVNANARYAVVIRFKNVDSDVYAMAFEYPIAEYTPSATANAGESMYSRDGTTWSDLTSYKANANFCIKAYLRHGQPVVTRPANDNFANATAISGASGSLTASSANATKEMGEPYHGISSATNSVWWKWTASAAGSMTITTEGSGFDTGLGIYTGSSVSALTKITDNDDNGAGGLWSSVTFTAVAGTTYYIAVAGYNGATGSVKLNWTFNGAAIAAPTITGYGGYTTYTYIEWNAVSGATGYRIYRATSSSSRPSTPHANVSSSSTVYCDYNGTPGVTYYYWLSAVGSAGESVSGPISTYRRADFAMLSPMSLSFDGLGGSQAVSVGANTSWQATKPATATWLTLSKTGTDGNGTLNVTAAANASSSARSATITLTAASGTAHPVTRTISVSQSAKSTISLATALDNTTLTFTTGGNVNWFGQTTNTHDGVDAAQSGKIGANQSSWMQTTVTGPGIISFWWYASSESVNYDYLAFSVDGTQKDKIGGTSLSWAKRSYELGSGTHTLKWTYEKDGSVSRGEDAGFVDQVTWTDNIVTEVRNLGIGFVAGGELYELTLKNGGKIAFYDAWLTDAGISTSGGITTSLLNAIGRNGLPRYQSYLFGFDPESTIPAEEQLKPTIEFDAAGTPIISCIPKMDNDLVTYTTLGKPSLDSRDWVVVTDSNRASMKFFKVKIELKEN